MNRHIQFFNKYSLLFHALLSMMLVFIIEVISRHSISFAAYLGICVQLIYYICIFISGIPDTPKAFGTCYYQRLLAFSGNGERLYSF